MKEEMLSAAAGAILGGLVSALAFLHRARFERKRTLNETLFVLLEVWYTIRVLQYLHAPAFSRLLVDVLRTRLPDELSDSKAEQEVRAFLGKYVTTVVRPMVREGASNLEAMYVKSVSELARVEPVLAYELSGNQLLHRHLSAMDSFIADVAGGAAQRNEEEEQRFIFGPICSATLKVLTRDLHRLARMTGVANYLRVWWKTGRRGTRAREAAMRTEVEQYVDGILRGCQPTHPVAGGETTGAATGE